MPFRRAKGRGTVEDRIRLALAGIPPLLHIPASAVQILGFERTSGVATLKIDAECPECDMPAARFREGITAHLRMEVPEVLDVRIIESSDA